MEGGTAAEEEEKEKDPHPIPEEHHQSPIMHWEELSERIAELEKQEQERREKVERTRDVWEEEEEEVRGRVAVSGSRRNNQRNLQLCFVNDSDSEEEEEGATRKVPMGAERNGCHGAGLKQEVAAALRALRDKLLAEQRRHEESPAGCSLVAARPKPLEQQELQRLGVPRLGSLKASLQQEVHALSSDLVAQLLVRDQLRTEQDAMLLDVQDLT